MTRLGNLLLGLVLAGTAAAETPKPIPLGDKAPNSNSLRDLRGNRRALHDFKGHSAVVLVFVGAECPISNLYLPGLVELEKKYRAKQVQFLAIYANEAEDLDQIASHASDRDLPFLVLKDFGQKLADSLGVTRVPSVVVLDGEFRLRYRGRIDDRYGVASRREKATRADLAQAIEEVVSQKKVTVAETEADGCLIGRDNQEDGEGDRYLYEARGSDPAESLPGLPSRRPAGARSRCSPMTMRSSTRTCSRK